jgi:hypothetical protein
VLELYLMGVRVSEPGRDTKHLKQRMVVLPSASVAPRFPAETRSVWRHVPISKGLEGLGSSLPLPIARAASSAPSPLRHSRCDSEATPCIAYRWRATEEPIKRRTLPTF